MKDLEANQAEIYLDELLEDFKEAWDLSDKTMAYILGDQQFKYDVMAKVKVEPDKKENDVKGFHRRQAFSRPDA